MVTSAAYRFNPIWGYYYHLQKFHADCSSINIKIICLLRVLIIVGIIYDEGFLPVLPKEGWTPLVSVKAGLRAVIAEGLSCNVHRLNRPSEKVDVDTSPHSPGTALYTHYVFSLKN